MISESKIILAVAAFFGAVISLSFIKKLTKLQAFSTMVGGTIFSYFATPPLATYWALTTEASYPVAFMIGVMGMNVAAALFNVTDFFRHNPEKALRILGRR